MTDQNSLAIPTEQENQDILLPEMIKSEVNFLVFPFFALSRKGLKDKTETEYRDVIKRGDEKLEILWNVSSNPKYGYPGPFDREVHKAVEQIISEDLKQRGSVTNPIALGSLYELCQRMGKEKFGGTEYKKIKGALERVTTTSVKSKGAFYSKEKRRWIEDIFHLYDRVIFEGNELPNGEIADTNYLFLGSWYLQSLNSFYVKPLDYQYLKSFRSKIASRLYEILGVRFYGLQSRGQSHIWLDYQILCQLLPITPQRYFSDAQAKLKSAHSELVKTKFLSRVRWEKKSKTEWVIHYYPGVRAKEDFKPKPKAIQETLELPPPESPKEGKKVSEPREASYCVSTGQNRANSGASELTPDQKNLFFELRERGVAKNQSLHLVQEHTEWIPRAIELWELERDKHPDKMENPAGYLVSIIEAGENWQPPGDFVSPQERERRRKEEKQRKQEAEAKEKEERRKRGQHIGRILKAMEGLTEVEKEEIRKEVLQRVEPIYQTQKNFDQISQRDIRSWQSRGMVETRLFTLRNQIIEERFLTKDEDETKEKPPEKTP